MIKVQQKLKTGDPIDYHPEWIRFNNIELINVLTGEIVSYSEIKNIPIPTIDLKYDAYHIPPKIPDYLYDQYYDDEI